MELKIESKVLTALLASLDGHMKANQSLAERRLEAELKEREQAITRRENDPTSRASASRSAAFSSR